MVQTSKHKGQLRTLVAWLLIFFHGFQPALAATQVEADGNVPKDKQPHIETAPNGLVFVNIAAPNGGGVSYNRYHNFQVGPEGLILNNSAGNVNTQLAGFIPGNPWVGSGSAKVILNEVSGNLPSQLNGYLEVAGSRADVVLANRNGIIGNGFGVINSDRVVLTTGAPVFGGSGSLEAFRVSGGEISVQGVGVDATSQQQLDLLARSVKVNAGVWGKSVNVVTGSNQVGYTTLTAAPIAPDNASPLPAVSLDVAAIGGMYAGKINLVGTEKGLGVNNLGILSSSDDMIIDQAGQIKLPGRVAVGGNLTLRGGDNMGNSGMLYVQGNLQAASMQTFSNIGVIVSGGKLALQGAMVENSGTVAAGINADGTMKQQGDLGLQANGILQNRGRLLAAGKADLQAEMLDLSGGSLAAGSNVALTAVGDLDHRKASLVTTGDVTIQVGGQISNGQGGSLIADQSITVQAGTFSGGGTATAGKDLVINVNGRFIQYMEGKYQANHDLRLTGGEINNKGSLAAVNSVRLEASQITTEDGSMVQTNGKATLTAKNQLQHGGTLKAGSVEINVPHLKNTGVISGNNIKLTATTVENSGDKAVVFSSGDSQIFTSDSLINKDNAIIYSGGTVLVAGSERQDTQGIFVDKTSSILNQSAKIEAGIDVLLNTQQLTNKKREFEVVVKEVDRTFHSFGITPYPGNYRARREYTESVVQGVFTKDSPIAEIFAGRDVFVPNADIFNEYSTIAAGRDNTATSSTRVNNVGYKNI